MYSTKMIRILFFFLLTLFVDAAVVYGQDILILRDSEQPVKCEIISITDSTITYRDWKSSDQTIKSFKLQDVLSYNLGKSTKQDAIGKEKIDVSKGMFEMYHMGEKLPGYIIALSGDTLRGEIAIGDVVKNQFAVDFTGSDGKTISYTPLTISGYGYNEIHYIAVSTGYKKPLHPSHKDQNEVLFLHRITDGHAKLYRAFKIEFNKGTLNANPWPPLYMGKINYEYVIQNPSSSFSSTFGKSSRACVVIAFEDQKGFMKELGDDKLRKDDIPGWVEKFNYWFDNH